MEKNEAELFITAGAGDIDAMVEPIKNILTLKQSSKKLSENKRYNFKKILEATVWILLGIGTVVLLVAAMYKKDSQHCKDVEITIAGVKNNFFIDKDDVNAMLEKMNYGKLKMQPVHTFDLPGWKQFLKKING